MVYAYMTQPLAAAFGPAWLTRGTGSVRFVKPVLDGEELVVRGAVTARNATGVTVMLSAGTAATAECATLSATIPAGRPTPVNVAVYPVAALPDPRPAATRAHLSSVGTLGTPHAHYDTARAADYLAKVENPLPLYRGADAVVHPGFYVELANRALDRNVAMGPWIHVGSVVRHLGGARVGDRLATRGKVRSVFEKKGREFVELDLVIVAGDSVRPRPTPLPPPAYHPRAPATPPPPPRPPPRPASAGPPPDAPPQPGRAANPPPSRGRASNPRPSRAAPRIPAPAGPRLEYPP